MNGSFRKKPNGGVELRVWLDMPDGSHVQKSFCRRTSCARLKPPTRNFERGRKRRRTGRPSQAGDRNGSSAKRSQSGTAPTPLRTVFQPLHSAARSAKCSSASSHQSDTAHDGQCRPLSKSARHHIFITIDQIMKSAVINGLCSRNPCDGIKIKPDTTFKHIEVYSPDEIACIIAHLDQPFGTAIAIFAVHRYPQRGDHGFCAGTISTRRTHPSQSGAL